MFVNKATMADHRDDMCYNLLSESGSIVNFFEYVFGFLYRKTDFYKIQENSNDKFGFPPGVAEQLVVKLLKKYEAQARNDEIEASRKKQLEAAQPAVQDMDINSDIVGEVEVKSESRKKVGKYEASCEGFNGAVREGYSWSQTVSDVDVAIGVPPTIMRGRQIKAEIMSSGLCIWCEGSEEPLIKGEFTKKTNKDESMWSLYPGKRIQVHLEKSEERWWDALFTNEPKIDVTKLDTTTAFEDLSDVDHMKIDELVWTKNNPAPRHSAAEEEMLKQAWDQEGSPFKDMPYDPTLVSFASNSASCIGSIPPE